MKAVNKGAGKASNISPSYQTQAGLLGHDGDLKQRSAHGHVAVIGHDRQEAAVNGSKEGEKEEVGGRARFGDDSAVFQQRCQHLGDDDGGLADVPEGKVAEEEVHGGVEPAIFAGQEDHSRVPQQSEYIETQKDQKERRPPPHGMFSEHSKEELCHYSVIPPSHPFSG